MKKLPGIPGILGIITVLMIVAGCAGAKKAIPRDDDVYGVRAYGYFMDGEFKRAIEVYKTGYAAARKDDNGKGAARYLSNIGRAYYELGLIDSAALYFAKAHEEFVILADKGEASRAAAWLALSFASAGDEAQARRWIGAASALMVSTDKNRQRDDGHYYAVMKALVDFRLTSKIGNESALDAAAAHYKKKKNHSALTTICLLRADAELTRSNCAEALRQLNDALAGIDNSREKYRRSGALLKLSAASFCTGDENKGRHYYERARDCAPRGVAVPPMDEVSSSVRRLR